MVGTSECTINDYNANSAAMRRIETNLRFVLPRYKEPLDARAPPLVLSEEVGDAEGIFEALLLCLPLFPLLLNNFPLPFPLLLLLLPFLPLPLPLLLVREADGLVLVLGEFEILGF